jgi:hypothetical protein
MLMYFAAPEQQIQHQWEVQRILLSDMSNWNCNKFIGKSRSHHL